MMGGGGPGHFLGLDEPEAGQVRLSQVDRQLVWRLAGYVRPYGLSLAVAAACMLIAAVAGLAGPYLLKVAIDTYVVGRHPAGLDRVALLYLMAALAAWLAGYGQAYLVSWVGQQVIRDLRRDMFARLQQMGLRFFDTLAAGRIMSRLTGDVDAVHQLVSSALVSLVNDSLSLVFIFALMLALNWRLALVSFLVLPLLLGVVAFFRGSLRRAFRETRRRMAEINASLAESISGVRVTQSFVREEQNSERFDQLGEATREAHLRSASLFAMLFPAIEVVAAGGTALVLWYSGVLQQAGAPLTLGDVAAFIALLARFFGPVRDLSQVYNVFQAAVVSAERIFELLDTRPDVVDRPGARPLPPVRGAVAFVGVRFGYDPTRPVIHGVDLRAAPGETIALVGPTGAGKSTLASLLARFYDPQGGQVTVDGHDLRDVTLRSWRAQLGIVLQDTFIFAGTVGENIRYGRPDASHEQVEAAALAVGAHEFIARLPRGYDAEVQERGVALSLGQRQLLAFARALLVDPRVLILDEATASIDSQTEVQIQRALATLLAGRTTLVIAHRLSTVRRADRIYYLEGGRVVEVGSHAQLLGQGGRYAALVRGQEQGTFSDPPGLAPPDPVRS